MKIKISLNTFIFALLLILVVVVLLKVKLSSPNTRGAQGISSAAASTTQTKLREINVITKRYSFSPSPIRLKLNEPVRFRITSQDVSHGFSVPELGIDETITPGKETVFEFTPTKKGTFTLLCSVICGPGHSGMRGQIIVN